ncbi:MAG: PEP-CTERM sorting domain-containing protein [Oxalobacteraceae bacterium]|nr:MAG: PEP-CTERM sorting domain-containing protein [Oxalobacteraceae bacterium]
MIRTHLLAAAAAISLAAPAVAQTVTHNADPSVPFTYGNGNGYTPANASVLTQGRNELAARFHITGQAASPSVNGVYSFALGTQNISFDYSIFGLAPLATGNIRLTNLLTGDVATYDSSLIPDANGIDRGYQGSQQLGFGFLNGNFPPFGDLNFDANVNNTYRFDLSDGTNTLTTFAQIGAGATGAVPEPSTWAMLILGFGAVGGAMRRRKVHTNVSFA